jgi:hypothetical protein
MAKKTQDPWEDLFNSCVGFFILIGIGVGLVIAGVIWGLVELAMWIF